jgi:hypothetical protein
LARVGQRADSASRPASSSSAGRTVTGLFSSASRQAQRW